MNAQELKSLRQQMPDVVYRIISPRMLSRARIIRLSTFTEMYVLFPYEQPPCTGVRIFFLDAHGKLMGEVESAETLHQAISRIAPGRIGITLVRMNTLEEHVLLSVGSLDLHPRL